MPYRHSQSKDLSPIATTPEEHDPLRAPFGQPGGNAAMQEAMLHPGADPSGPFAPWLNTVLSACFGSSLSGLQVKRGADQDNQALSAVAHTTGREIALSSKVTERPSDPFSMEVIAHEVAHALAGGGSDKEMVDQPGDPGEARADGAGASFSEFMAGNTRDRLPALQTAVGGRATVHRHQVAMPWDYDDKEPVHENITLLTIQQAMKNIPPDKRGNLLKGVSDKALPKKNGGVVTSYDSSVEQFLRGNVWPDDPMCLMFDSARKMNYSMGIKAGTTFQEAEKLSKAGKEQTTLMGRSHFGDLQYLHGMASKEGEDPKDTKANMMAWSKFNVMVATGQITSSTKLSDIKELEGMFTGTDQADYTVKDLFGGNKDNAKKLTDDDVKQRAMGTLLHMVQDSHAEGHVERDPKTGEIIQFHTYGDQDPKKHDKKDAFGKGKTLQEKIANTPGAEEEILQGSTLLTMMDQGESTDNIMSYLDQKVFALSPDAKPAAAGEEFKIDVPTVQSSAPKGAQAVAAPAAVEAARGGIAGASSAAAAASTSAGTAGAAQAVMPAVPALKQEPDL